MAKKEKKIGKMSSRQGGAYKQGEVDLWEDILLKKGKKRHISTHTNTDTGRVQVLERDIDGNVTDTIDDFEMDDFQTIKDGILEKFPQ